MKKGKRSEVWVSFSPFRPSREVREKKNIGKKAVRNKKKGLWESENLV